MKLTVKVLLSQLGGRREGQNKVSSGLDYLCLKERKKILSFNLLSAHSKLTNVYECTLIRELVVTLYTKIIYGTDNLDVLSMYLREITFSHA